MPTKSHSLHAGRPDPPPGGRHAHRHEGGAGPRRAPEHGPGVERGGTAALLPDQRPRRSPLPPGRPPAVPAAAESPSPAAAAEAGRRRGPRRDRAPTLTETPAGLDLLADLAEVASFPSGLDPALDEACRRIRIATGAALVGIWERRPGGLVPRATDVEGAGRHRRCAASRPAGACSPWRSRPRSPIHARPGDPSPAPMLGMGTDELVVAIPGGEAAVGRARASRARCSSARTTAAGSPRRSPGRWASSCAAPARPSRRRPASAAPRPCAASPPTSPRGSTSPTSSATSPTTPGCCSAPTAWRSSSATPRAASRRPAARASPRRSSASPASSSRPASASARSRRAGPSSLLGPEAPRSSSPVRAAAIQEGVESLLRRARSWTATSSTASSTWPTTGRTAGARWTSTPPRRSRATRRSPCARRAPSAGWRPGPPSCSRSSASAPGSRASPTSTRSATRSPRSSAS